MKYHRFYFDRFSPQQRKHCRSSLTNEIRVCMVADPEKNQTFFIQFLDYAPHLTNLWAVGDLLIPFSSPDLLVIKTG